MISLRNIKVVFKKEFLQIMRDKSVLFTNFFIPLFGIPLYVIFVLEAATYKEANIEAPLKDNTVFSISYQGAVAPDIQKALQDDAKIKLVPLNKTLSEDEIINYRRHYEEYHDLKEKSLSLKVQVTKDTEELKDNNDKLSLAREKMFHSLEILQNKYQDLADLHVAFFEHKEEDNSPLLTTYLFYNDDKNTSKAAKKYIEELLQNFEDQLIIKYKEKKGITKNALNPLAIKDVNLDRSSDKFAKTFGLGLGAIILFFLLISILNPTINTTIGERDQNTYKVLLMNPVSLHEIFIGKYLNVALQGLLTLLPYSIESIVAYSWGNSNFLFQFLPELTFVKLLIIFIGTVSGAIFLSSLCFLVCSFSKSRVQAQSMVTLLIFLLIIPIVTIGVMDVKLSYSSAFLPLVNFPLITENLLQTSPHYAAAFLAFAVNIIISFFLIWFSLGAFTVQWKGKSDTVSVSDLLSKKKRKTSRLTPAHGFLAFALSFVGYVYGGTLISILEIDLFNFLFAPLLFCLGVAVLLTSYSGLDLVKTYQWGKIEKGYALKLLFCAFALSLGFNYLFQMLPELETLKVKFPEVFGSNQFASGFSYFLLFAVIPAFCEEILFRGIIFKGFRNQYSFLIAATLSSLFFAIIHFSLFKWGHTFIGGFLMAYIYEKRGLLNAILFHLLFNSFGLLFGFSKNFAKLIFEGSAFLNGSVFIAALLIIILILKSDTSQKTNT